MSFPQFSRLLPYRDYNQESGLFMNDTTMGFMLEAIPINGANESIVEALDHMLRTKLPRGIPLCIHLMSSQLVGDRIEYGLREFSWSGEQAERFNAITRAYYMKAAATQFPLPEGMNLPLTLRHYLEGGDLDIAYLSEIDPTWTDSSLTTILNPEAVIFANPIAQGACAADAIASAFNMPLDVLFWCAGSQGSMYPFNGWVSNESSPLQSSLLVSERMAFKLHRQGMIMETIGKNNAVCNEYPSPILPKERWRYQMVNMYPDSGQCHPFGRSVTRWETGKNPPNTKKNFGYLMWRKRNCVFL
ncbi:TPA: conjugal transfer pilus assembly protein TraU [Escherichia coli]|nr:conjugal transfer pilus assembly protein TraU [Escherichia coli]